MEKRRNAEAGEKVDTECLLCEVVEDICEQVSSPEGRKVCKLLADQVQKGEVDPTEARRELLKFVREEDLRKATEKVLSRLGYKLSDFGVKENG